MVERTRTFVGVLPDSLARDAWQQAHDEMCMSSRAYCAANHTNPYPEQQRVLVHLFEEVRSAAYGTVDLKGMEVALRSGDEDRFARWGRPAKMTEET